MTDISTYTGNHGRIANQIMGSTAGYWEYLKARSDAHVQLYYQGYHYLKRSTKNGSSNSDRGNRGV